MSVVDQAIKQKQLISDVYSSHSSSIRGIPRSAFIARQARRPNKYATDIITINSKISSQKDYARFYRSKPAVLPNVTAVTIARTYVQNVVPVSTSHRPIGRTIDAHMINRSEHAQANKQVIGQPNGKPKKIKNKKALLVNGVIALAVLMSGLLGFMAYRYHVAVQRVEAQSPISQAPVGDDTQSVLGAVTDVQTVSDVSEAPQAKTASSGGRSTAIADAPYILTIPRLKVSANIKGLGITKSGAVDVPGNIWQVGWYTSSAKPKDNTGVVLLNGHVHGPTMPGVFANLKNLVAGDLITVTDTTGVKFNYKVISKSTHKAGDNDPSMFQSVSPDKQGLNLVTCDGKIIDSHYEDRLVVFAERI